MYKIIIPAVLLTVLISSPASVFGGVTSTVVNLGPNGESPQMPIELVQMHLVSASPIPIPLASDPRNLLQFSTDGYGFVDSVIEIKLSSLRASPGPQSLGSMQLKLVNPIPHPGPNEVSSGDIFQVDSFFDVFYDITITDVDTREGRDFVNQPPGASVVLQNLGPVRLSAHYPCSAVVSLPVMGCLPQLANELFVGNLPLSIPLGVDVNANGENDKIKIKNQNLGLGVFTQSQFVSGDYTVSFESFNPPDSPFNDDIDSFFDIRDAAVADESADPPFVGVLNLGPPVIILVPAPGALPPLPSFPDDNEEQVIGGSIIPVDTTALLLAGSQTSLVWILPLILGGVGLVVFRLRKD